MRQTNNPFCLEANYGDAALRESIMQQAGVSTVSMAQIYVASFCTYIADIELYPSLYTHKHTSLPKSVQDQWRAAASNIGDGAWRRKENSPMQIDDVDPVLNIATMF